MTKAGVVPRGPPWSWLKGQRNMIHRDSSEELKKYYLNVDDQSSCVWWPHMFMATVRWCYSCRRWQGTVLHPEDSQGLGHDSPGSDWSRRWSRSLPRPNWRMRRCKMGCDHWKQTSEGSTSGVVSSLCSVALILHRHCIQISHFCMWN